MNNEEKTTELPVGKNRVAIILPALNEAPTIGKVLDEIPKPALEQDGYQVEVVVVDSNSRDETAQMARDKGARLISAPGIGKARAVRTALASIEADFLIMLDADYTYPATYIPEMLRIMRSGCPVVVGSRLRGQREKGAIRRLNLIGNVLLTSLANILYGTRISDLCTGYWGMRREVIPELELRTGGFQLEAEIFTQLAKKGYSIAEVPIFYRRRPSKAKLNRVRDGVRIAWLLVSRRF
jgi:dolichol-phosphate mannosyltransferase